MAKSIVDGEPLVGYLFNQTKEWAARRGEDFGKYDSRQSEPRRRQSTQSTRGPRW